MEEDHEREKDIFKEKSDMCRLCFGSTDVTVNIAQHADKSTSIIEKIHYCTSLIVKLGDNFPQNICVTCDKNLDLMYNFKTKAIACDLELSKNVRKDIHFTYIQVSDDHSNITYKLDLEQDSSTHLGDSCVYNIVDGDELQIEPVNVTVDKNEYTSSVINDKNDSTISTESLKDDHQNENSDSSQNSKISSNFKNVNLKRSSVNSFSKHKNDQKSKKTKSENAVEDEKPSLIIKNGKVVYVCGVCNFEAESIALLLSHNACAHSKEDNFKCYKCNTSYKTAAILQRHTLLSHKPSHFCEHCGKKFLNKQGLDRHINSSHRQSSPLEFQCVKCSASFDTMDKMEDHLVVHYTNPSSIFNCNHCSRSFSTFLAKKKHIEIEHIPEFECEICHVVLPSREAMDKHNNSVHQPKKSGNKKYACTTCGLYFTSIKDILAHRKIHSSAE